MYARLFKTARILSALAKNGLGTLYVVIGNTNQPPTSKPSLMVNSPEPQRGEVGVHVGRPQEVPDVTLHPLHGQKSQGDVQQGHLKKKFCPKYICFKKVLFYRYDPKVEQVPHSPEVGDPVLPDLDRLLDDVVDHEEDVQQLAGLEISEEHCSFAVLFV